jgi:NAD(P)H-dependent FMN reductase
VEPRINLGLIYGSAREGRFVGRVARWAARHIENDGGFALDVLDPLELALPVHPPHGDDPAVSVFRRRLERADAFIVVTPEYNHGYPAALKHLIDSAYAPWHAKPVAFVSYGGGSGGLRAVEQLRQVFAELHAVTIRDGVSLANIWDRFDSKGELRDRALPDRAMSKLLDQLKWWARALRRARELEPYGRIAA